MAKPNTVGSGSLKVSISYFLIQQISFWTVLMQNLDSWRHLPFRSSDPVRFNFVQYSSSTKNHQTNIFVFIFVPKLIYMEYIWFITKFNIPHELVQQNYLYPIYLVCQYVSFVKTLLPFPPRTRRQEGSLKNLNWCMYLFSS